MTAYAYNANGWYDGEVPDGTPGAVTEPPPVTNTSTVPGLQRALWWRFAWQVETYPEPPPAPPPPPPAYAFDGQGWYTGEVPIGTPGSTTAAPDIASTSATPGDARARWQHGAWTTQAYAPRPRHITGLAFLSRFTATERKGIRSAAKNNADLEDYIALSERASYVDLDRLDTISSTYALEAMGLIAVGRAAEILTNPIQDSERPAA